MFRRLLTLYLLILRPASAWGDIIASVPYAAAAATRGEVTNIDLRSPWEWRQTGNPTGAWPVRILSTHDFKKF